MSPPSLSTPSAVGFKLPAQAPSAARTVLQWLQRLRHGCLTLQLPDGSQQRFGQVAHAAHAGEPALQASMRMHNWSVCSAVLKSGDIGLAESFISGDWSSPDISALLGLFLANRREMEDAIYGSWWGRQAYRLRHWMNRNTLRNSRKNIHAHYDLGNPFYQLWLDETMNYSAALFEHPGQSLPDAQRAKVRRALSECRVGPGQRVLEIGCGWGALAEMACHDLGAELVGVTLSTEQLAYAQSRLARLGCAAQADLRLQDYRLIDDGPYDAVCSIEMVEAVGQAYWPTYFQTVARLLKPGGRACIQSIVIHDDLFERYLQGTDFIQQYIFPGGCLPSPKAFEAAAQAAGLQVVERHAFGPDYATTLRLWRERFMAQQAAVQAQGFDQRFMLTWEFYLAYCEAAFNQGSTDVLQFTLQKPA